MDHCTALDPLMSPLALPNCPPSVKTIRELSMLLKPPLINVFNTFDGVINSSEVILSWAKALPAGMTMGETRMGTTLNNIDYSRHAGKPDFPEGFGYIAFTEAFPSQELVDSYFFKNNGNHIQKKGRKSYCNYC